MGVREEDFELSDGLLVDFTAEHISGEEDVGRPTGWYVEIDEVYTIVQSKYLATGEEEISLTTYDRDAVEEVIIKYLEG